MENCSCTHQACAHENSKILSSTLEYDIQAESELVPYEDMVIVPIELDEECYILHLQYHRGAR